MRLLSFLIYSIAYPPALFQWPAFPLDPFPLPECAPDAILAFQPYLLRPKVAQLTPPHMAVRVALRLDSLTVLRHVIGLTAWMAPSEREAVLDRP